MAVGGSTCLMLRRSRAEKTGRATCEGQADRPEARGGRAEAGTPCSDAREPRAPAPSGHRRFGHVIPCMRLGLARLAHVARSWGLLAWTASLAVAWLTHNT
jgi:hypothetical protein